MDNKDTPQNPSTAPDVEPSTTQPQAQPQPFDMRRSEREAPLPFNATSDQVSDPSAVATTGLSTATPKKSKRGLLITLIAVALLLLSLGLAYVYWFQNPNKVVSDALVHALSAKSLTYTGAITTAGDSKMIVTLNGGAATDGGTVNAKLAYEVENKKYTLDGNAIVDKKNDIYFKVQNIDSLVNNYRRAIPPESQPLFDQIIDKVNDKWVKISSEDLKSYSPDLVKNQECLADAIRDVQNDGKVRSELIDTYEKHPFITINKTLGSKNGSLGYSLKSSGDVEKAFDKEFRNTAFYKSLVKCDDSFAIKDEDLRKQYKDSFGDNTTAEIWVDRWSHQITKLAFKQDEGGQVTNVAIEPTFNRPVAIVTPKDATTIEQLQKDIQALLQSAQPVVAPTSSPATES